MRGDVADRGWVAIEDLLEQSNEPRRGRGTHARGQSVNGGGAGVGGAGGRDHAPGGVRARTVGASRDEIEESRALREEPAPQRHRRSLGEEAVPARAGGRRARADVEAERWPAASDGSVALAGGVGARRGRVDDDAEARHSGPDGARDADTTWLVEGDEDERHDDAELDDGTDDILDVLDHPTRSHAARGSTRALDARPARAPGRRGARTAGRRHRLMQVSTVSTQLGQFAARRAPAALAWRDAHVPVLGGLRANAWLPTILLAASLVALVYLLQISGVATTGYDVQRLQAERADWQLRNEQLRLELAKRRSLTWVEAEATGRLGMQRPDAASLTYLKPSR